MFNIITIMFIVKVPDIVKVLVASVQLIIHIIQTPGGRKQQTHAETVLALKAEQSA